MPRCASLSTGLPRRITLYHGTVFYDNTSPSPFPTRLHLWLLALGIDVCFTRKRCPTDHATTRAHTPSHDAASEARASAGQVKRCYGLAWTRAGPCASPHIPSGALQGHAPLQAYPGAANSNTCSPYLRINWPSSLLLRPGAS